MELPIEAALSGKRLSLARMQDLVIRLIYDYAQPDAILYGGTAVWRCFGGGRFSEDIDIYVKEGFSRKFEKILSKSSISILGRDVELPLHMRLSDGETEMLLEASVGRYESVISQYVRTDGTLMIITTLSPVELLIRKMEAYEGRRFVRDLYDIVHLTNYADRDDHYLKRRLKQFLKGIEEPEDEGILASLVYKGPVMPFAKMVKYLQQWSG